MLIFQSFMNITQCIYYKSNLNRSKYPVFKNKFGVECYYSFIEQNTIFLK